MRRSHQVAAPLLAATALAMLTACRRQPEMQRCVDQNNHVVAENFCQQPGTTGSPYPMGYMLPYRYYYGGGGGYGLGSSVFGGGYSSLGGHSYTNATGSSTVRGGFGSTHSSGSGSRGSGE